MTVHHVKGVVGPSVQIDDEGMISATWVEEDKDTRTILFSRSRHKAARWALSLRQSAW